MAEDHQQKKLWHSTDTLNDIKDWVDSANTGLQAVAEVSVEDPVVEVPLADPLLVVAEVLGVVLVVAEAAAGVANSAQCH